MKSFPKIYEFSKKPYLCRCFLVLSYQDLFLQNGGRIIDNEKVLKIIPGQVVTLKTKNRELKAKKIVVAAGRFKYFPFFTNIWMFGISLDDPSTVHSQKLKHSGDK